MTKPYGNTAADALRQAAQAAKATSDASQAKKPSENEGLTLDEIRERSYNRAVQDTWIGRVGKDLYDKYALVKRTYDTSDVVWNTYLKPVSYFLNPVFSMYWKGCKNIYNRVAFDSEGNYNAKRAPAAILGLTALTGVIAWNAPSVAVSTVARTYHFMYDATAVNFFSYEDTMVFGKADPIGENGDAEFSVFACRKSPCKAQVDSMEYRIRDSDYLDLMSWLTRFAPNDPGEQAGGFLSEEQACKVKYFGTRRKALGWYPYIIDSVCVSINGEMSAEEALAKVRAIDLDGVPQDKPAAPAPAF